MRALLLLLTASVLLWGVYQYAEKSSVEAAPDEPAPAVSEGRFLVGETAGEAPETAPGPAPRAEDPAPLPGGDGWLEPATAGPQRVELAAVLLHGSPGEIGERLRSGADALDGDEALTLLAFAEALAGRLEDARSRLELLREPEALHPLVARAVRAAVEGLPAPSLEEARLAGAVPLALAMRLRAQEGLRATQEGRPSEAAARLSEVLVAELDAPWPADRGTLRAWSQALGEAQARHRFDRRGEWPSIDLEVQDGDSLTVLRKRALDRSPGLVVNTGLIAQVNELGEGYLHAGEVIRVPTDPIRTLVDLSARWVLVFAGDEVLAAFECGIGKPEDPTITGEFSIGVKKENPTWFPRGKEPVPYGDPQNPLGTRWMGWSEGGDRDTSYGFHGTNEPDSIGLAQSEGCIRMHNRDAERLFELLPRGSAVVVRE